jgi:translocation and assembly module TamB
LKRWLKRAGLALGALLLLVLVAVTFAWFYVTGSTGSERVRVELLRVLGETLAGRFEAKQLTLHGGLIVLEDVKLFTPEGELVGEVHHAVIDASLWALVEKHVVVRSAKLTGVRLYLQSDERGLNLVRAVAAKHPAPPSTGPGSAFYVDVQKLDLSDSFVSYPPYALNGIALAGGAVVSGPTLKLDGKLAGGATLEGEPQLPLSLAVASASEPGSGVKFDVVLGLADAKLDGTLHVPKLSAEVRSLVVPPEVAHRFLPQSPLVVALRANGTLDLEQAALALEAGRANANVTASYRGSTLESAQVEAHDVDLAELFGSGKASRIDLTAHGRLADAHPGTLDAAVQASGTWRTPEGSTLANVSVDATAVKGQLDLKRAEVSVPGAQLEARGAGTLEALHLAGSLDASDLSKLSATLAEFTGAAPPPLAGHGRLDLRVDGPARHPGVKAHGVFDTLHAGSIRASAVRAAIALPDVARPFEAQAQLDAAQVIVAEHELDDVHARVGTQGRVLDVEVSTQGMADLALLAHGQLDDDAKGLGLDQLELRYPEERWTLQGPTHLALGDGFALDVTRLGSADQRIEVRAVQKDGRLDAGLDAQRVDLAKLPHALIPDSLNLGGRASLHATAVGASGAPQVDAQVSVRDGGVRNVSKISLDLNATYAKQRVQARVRAASSVGGVEADVDVPLKGDGPLKAHVLLSDVILDQLSPLLEQDVPVSGKATVQLEASGTAQKPHGTLHAEGADLELRIAPKPGPKPGPAVSRAPNAMPSTSVLADRSDRLGADLATKRIRVERLSLDVQPDAQERLTAALTAHAFGAQAEVKLGTELTVEKLRKKLPDAAALAAMPLELQADVKELHLRRLVEAQLLSDFSGVVSFTAHGTGSVQHPNVDATVSFEQLHTGRLKPQDGSLSLAASRDETRVHLSVGKTTLTLDAQAHLPLERMADVDALAHAAFEAEGKAGPLTLGDVLEPNPDQPHPQGTLQATLTASGTPLGPKVQVRGTADHLMLGKTPLGHADVALDYADAVTTLTAALINEAAGRMDAKGRLALDLSHRVVLKGVDWKSAPLNVEVQSKALDLSWLSGVTEKVPKVGGTLDASATVSGPLGAPSFKGHAAWEKGTVAVAGYGEYRDIAVELDGTETAITLKQLYAKSSGGFVKLKAALVKQPGQQWRVHADGETQSFPIVVDDQLKATASLELVADGTASATLIDLGNVSIPRATIELPEVKAKDLQDLERPANIVLVRNGVPLNARQQRKMHLGRAVAAPAPEAAGKTTVRLKLNAPRNIWVKGSDEQLELGLSNGFQVEVDGAASLAGELSVKRGRIDVIGRRFDVDPQSTVRFSGPATRAYVNVTANYKNEREGVTVTAVVTGQMPQFAIHLTSNPPMAESDIFTLVATGRRQLKEGGSQTVTGEQAVSVVGSLIASQFKSVLSKNVPIDVLSVESGNDGFKGTRVEAGKYVTDQVYVGAEVRYGADPRKGENTAAARLEYQFTPHWSFDVYGGDAGAFGADLVWSKDF